MEIKITFESLEEIDEFAEKWNNQVYRPSIDDEKDQMGNWNVQQSTFFRDYGKCNKLPTFLDVSNTGIISLKRGDAQDYDIHTILELKRLIPLTDEYPNWNSLKKAVRTKANQMTVKRICYVIEKGGADHIINKWENLTPKFNKYGQII